MNYEQLKRLPLNELLSLVREQIQVAQNAWSPHTLCSRFETEKERGFYAPVLVMVGDFEIRARFHTPEPIPIKCQRGMFTDTPCPNTASWTSEMGGAWCDEHKLAGAIKIKS